ncbi:uncharacterized protein [Palaemon carinicauda]|uniref:uncharacterized protein n=1 Tax=Palaemon carinicauda TaxID=392227 RepID=UPI0035B57746
MDYKDYLTLGILAISWIFICEGVIISRGYQRSILPKTSLSCSSSTNPLPSNMSTSDLFYSSILCSKENCSAFCIVDTDCLLLDLVVSPGELTATVTSETILCYVPISTTGTTTTDLLRGKAVTPQESWGGTYAAVETVVTGARCEKVAEDCFCTIDSLWPSVVVNMGILAKKSVAKVVVTMSSFYPDYFSPVEVRVGFSGTRDDALLTNYSGTPNYGERLVLEGDQSLLGMYVSIFRNVPSPNSLCFCLMEAYGA